MSGPALVVGQSAPTPGYASEAISRLASQEGILWRSAQLELGWPRTPIVALTANAFPSNIEGFFGVGADDILLKPYRIEELAGKLEKWVPRR